MYALYETNLPTYKIRPISHKWLILLENGAQGRDRTSDTRIFSEARNSDHLPQAATFGTSDCLN